MNTNRIKAVLHQLADLSKPSYSDGELGKISDYENLAIEDAYRQARITVGYIGSHVNFTLERARHLAFSFATEQERLTGKPHMPITEKGCTKLFTSVFLKPLVFNLVTDTNAAVEYFKFKQYHQIVRAEFNDFADWVSSRG